VNILYSWHAPGASSTGGSLILTGLFGVAALWELGDAVWLELRDSGSGLFFPSMLVSSTAGTPFITVFTSTVTSSAKMKYDFAHGKKNLELICIAVRRRPF